MVVLAGRGTGLGWEGCGKEVVVKIGTFMQELAGVTFPGPPGFEDGGEECSVLVERFTSFCPVQYIFALAAILWGF